MIFRKITKPIKKDSHLQKFLASFDLPIAVTRRSKTKNLALRVYIGGSVGLSAPQRFSDKKIVAFIIDKADWLQKVVETKQQNAAKILGSKDARHLLESSNAHFIKYKAKSLKLVNQSLLELNRNNWPYEKVSVKNTKTRWGSCSSKSNLNFNYKILFLNPELQDYLVIHELCHLKHQNHSKVFWAEVESQIPNYKNLDKQLRSL